jgi:hypothetical protein
MFDDLIQIFYDALYRSITGLVNITWIVSEFQITSVFDKCYN